MRCTRCRRWARRLFRNPRPRSSPSPSSSSEIDVVSYSLLGLSQMEFLERRSRGSRSGDLLNDSKNFYTFARFLKPKPFSSSPPMCLPRTASRSISTRTCAVCTARTATVLWSVSCRPRSPRRECRRWGWPSRMLKLCRSVELRTVSLAATFSLLKVHQ